MTKRSGEKKEGRDCICTYVDEFKDALCCETTAARLQDELNLLLANLHNQSRSHTHRWLRSVVAEALLRCSLGSNLAAAAAAALV